MKIDIEKFTFNHSRLRLGNFVSFFLVLQSSLQTDKLDIDILDFVSTIEDRHEVVFYKLGKVAALS